MFLPRRVALTIVLALCVSAPSFAGEIHRLVEQNDKAGMEKLLKADAELLNDRDDNGRTPLLLACEYRKVEMVRWLLDAGSDVNAPDKYGVTPLCRVVQWSEPESVEVARLDRKSVV